MFPLFGADTKGDPVFAMRFPPRQNVILVGPSRKRNCTKIRMFRYFASAVRPKRDILGQLFFDAKSVQQTENVPKNMIKNKKC